MRLDDFDYELPQELIAQTPPAERGAGRLLHVDGRTGAFTDRQFRDILGLVGPDDVLVFNDTRVIKARLRGRKATGGRVFTILGDPNAVDPDDALERALTAAYDQIEQELRSQYVMAFSTPQPLTAQEIESLKVEVSRSGVKVRRVVGTTRG